MTHVESLEKQQRRGATTAADHEAALQPKRPIGVSGFSALSRAGNRALDGLLLEDDYLKAEKHIEYYYREKFKIVGDLFLGAHTALHLFGDYSSMADHGRPEIPLATVKAVLQLIPGASPILEIIENLERSTQIAQEIAGLAGDSKKGHDAHEATAEALQKAVLPYFKENQVLLKSQRRDTDYLLNLRRDSRYRGRLFQEVYARLGPIPEYDPEILESFGLEYELQLYREYYVENAFINRLPPSFLGSPYTSYHIVGVPEAAQKRILHLYKKLGHNAKVSIDPRYDPFHAEVVKILLDWGVKLYWMKGSTLGVKDKPTTLHTGADLRQPYRGDRYKEVDALP